MEEKVRVIDVAKAYNVSTDEIKLKLKELGVMVKRKDSVVPSLAVSKLNVMYAKDRKQRAGQDVSVGKPDETNSIKITDNKNIRIASLKSVRSVKTNKFNNATQKTYSAKPIMGTSKVPDKLNNVVEKTANNKPKINTFNKPNSTHKISQGKNTNQKNHQLKSNKHRGVSALGKFNKNNKNQKSVNKKKPESRIIKSAPVEPEIKIVSIKDSISVRELGEKAKIPVKELIKVLIKDGQMVSINEEISFEIAEKLLEGYNIIAEYEEEEKQEDVFKMAFLNDSPKIGDEIYRAPVVVIMGHVDHGKTSLLDAIKNSKIQATEAGGITQHIGAYQVPAGDKLITFLDTPGHEAFTAMRMRGAQVTDIAVLVVAADDGVMPQTIEAINHAKAADVEIIVAINKMDKPSANPERVKQELTEYGLIAESWGGNTICVEVSALNRVGINSLLEMINLVAEVKELKANPNARAEGTVVEAMLHKNKGSVITLLVKQGTLKVGDPVVIGSMYGKIRAMVDYKGDRIKIAFPSTPVEVLGISGIPMAGDYFYVADNEKQARQLAESVEANDRRQLIKNTHNKVSLDDLFTQIQMGAIVDLNVIIKADVQGSSEALKTSLIKLSNDNVRIKVVHSGVGSVTETDVMLASTTGAIVIGFNTKVENQARLMADNENVDIKLYKVIYDAIDDISLAMKGMLAPEYEEVPIGRAEVRKIFKSSNIGNIAGSYVLEGKISRDSSVRLVRNKKTIYDGPISELKRFKDDVKEVSAGYECGISLIKHNDIEEGDILEVYIMKEKPLI
jgi:translation initiation factor IF-2